MLKELIYENRIGAVKRPYCTNTSSYACVKISNRDLSYRSSHSKYDIPSMKNCSNPDKTCVCGHARMVMYISAEGRTLPCMALSGMDIQQDYPLIPAIGLAKCITDSRYMELINTRAAEVLKHNPECASCEYAMQCLAGCRASALETSPTDILAPDMAICGIFKGGWTEKIAELMKDILPQEKTEAVSYKEAKV